MFLWVAGSSRKFLERKWSDAVEKVHLLELYCLQDLKTQFLTTFRKQTEKSGCSGAVRDNHSWIPRLKKCHHTSPLLLCFSALTPPRPLLRAGSLCVVALVTACPSLERGIHGKGRGLSLWVQLGSSTPWLQMCFSLNSMVLLKQGHANIDCYYMSPPPSAPEKGTAGCSKSVATVPWNQDQHPRFQEEVTGWGLPEKEGGQGCCRGNDSVPHRGISMC